jgi:hypothetical protein
MIIKAVNFYRCCSLNVVRTSLRHQNGNYAQIHAGQWIALIHTVCASLLSRRSIRANLINAKVIYVYIGEREHINIGIFTHLLYRHVLYSYSALTQREKMVNQWILIFTSYSAHYRSWLHGLVHLQIKRKPTDS